MFLNIYNQPSVLLDGGTECPDLIDDAFRYEIPKVACPF
jgi:hypothetical protein